MSTHAGRLQRAGRQARLRQPEKAPGRQSGLPAAAHVETDRQVADRRRLSGGVARLRRPAHRGVHRVHQRRGFESPLKIPTEPKDLSFLATPAGGDQLMFTELDGGRWTTPIAAERAGGDLFGIGLGAGRPGAAVGLLVGQRRRTTGTSMAGSATAAADGPTRSASPRRPAPTSTTRRPPTRKAGCGLPGRASARPIPISSWPGRRPKGSASRRPWPPRRPTTGRRRSPPARDGRVAVAWDSYAKGNYDVSVRVWQDGKWGPPQLVTGTLANEARPSLAFDPKNRLWIAYEISPEGWGKDFGPYDQSPTQDGPLQAAIDRRQGSRRHAASAARGRRESGPAAGQRPAAAGRVARPTTSWRPGRSWPSTPPGGSGSRPAFAWPASTTRSAAPGSISSPRSTPTAGVRP